MHTPKSGMHPAENDNQYLQNYKENKFLQTFMRHADGVARKWVEEQQPKVQKVFNSDLKKFLTEASPYRNARKIYQDNLKNERQQINELVKYQQFSVENVDNERDT